MTQPITVWTEMPVRDIAAAVAFYDAVLGTTSTINRDGPVAMANIGDAMETVGCTLFEGTPVPGTVLHFAVDALEAAAGRLTAAGGTVTGEPVTIPVGRFIHATDPDGNRIGLFEAKG
jgi:uncharacterized protein